MKKLLILACFIASQTQPASKAPLPIKLQRAVYYNMKLRSLYRQEISHGWSCHSRKFTKQDTADQFISAICLKASGIPKPTKAQREAFITESKKQQEKMVMFIDGLVLRGASGWHAYPFYKANK